MDIENIYWNTGSDPAVNYVEYVPGMRFTSTKENLEKYLDEISKDGFVHLSWPEQTEYMYEQLGLKAPYYIQKQAQYEREKREYYSKPHWILDVLSGKYFAIDDKEIWNIITTSTNIKFSQKKHMDGETMLILERDSKEIPK